jgi:hypothetical protein
MKDPIVEEVRKHRIQHTRKFKGNLAAICANLREVEEESGHEIVRLRPETRRTGSASRQRQNSRQK